MNYCSNCGHKISFGEVPEEDRPRYHCPECKTVHYQNPNMIVGCIPCWQEQILLCKRAIEPRRGLWTLPAGFLEIGESVEEGAVRETREEANANVDVVRLFSVYDLPRVGQVYLMFLADLVDLEFHPGKESLEVQLFSQPEIPWKELAFGAVAFSIEKYFESLKNNADSAVVLGRKTPSRSWTK